MPSQIYDIDRSHGRADYRRGIPFKMLAADGWRAGWTEEAHLGARALAEPQMANAMNLIAALDALYAANRIATQCVTHKPTIRQATMLAADRPVVADALARLKAAYEPADSENEIPA